MLACTNQAEILQRTRSHDELRRDAPCTVVCTGHGTARAAHLRVMQSILKRTQAYSKYALYNTIPGLATRRYIY